MPDILRTSTSALVAFQRALAVTGNNIANANTEGYSRQRVDLAAREPQPFGNGFVGRGVDVSTVRRVVDRFAVATQLDAGVQLGQLATYADFATRVDNVVGDRNAGLSGALQSFFDAWQTVANDPASLTNRQLLLGQAQGLADRFTQLSGRLGAIAADVTTRLAGTVGEINDLAASIAKLNDQITTAQAAVGGQPANELLDRRDQLVLQLGRLVGVQTTTDGDGAVNVFVGSGQALVLRGKAFGLAATPNAFDASRLDVAYVGGGGPQAITAQIGGGAIGGLLTVQSDLVDPVRNAIGRLALGVANLVNGQQAQGFDLRGQFGAALFATSGPLAYAAGGNAGTGSLSARVADLGALGIADFQLRWSGSAWVATDVASGQPVAVAGTGTVADPLRFGGLEVVVAGAPAAGDRFLVRPTQTAAASFRAVLTDPRSLAAAAPIRTQAAPANVGTGAISAGEVVDAANPALLATATIRFLTPTTYSIDGGPAIAYVPGADVAANGWRVRLSGAPAAGDTFTVARNAGGVGDNRNALAMAALVDRGLFDGGTTGVGLGYASLVATVGGDTRQAQLARDAQAAIADDAEQGVLRASGVNLDEEAADLLRWQQAYGAAAKVVQVADEAFQRLLAAVRG